MLLICVKIQNQVVPAHTIKAYKGSSNSVISSFLTLAVARGEILTLCPAALPLGKDTPHPHPTAPIVWGLSGSERQCKRFREVKSLILLPGIEPQLLRFAVHSIVTVFTVLVQLHVMLKRAST
jgi:hypothetical protein